MRGIVITAIAILTTCVGCKQYMRYRPDADVTPLEARSSGQYLTTNDYLRLGMILQRELGRPYQGRSKWEAGIDCSAFTREAFQDFNSMQLPRTVEEQFKMGKEISHNRLKFGDLVFFRTERRGVSHVGVFIGFNEFIHVSTSIGVTINNLSEEYWARCYVGARRVLGPPPEPSGP
jgi:cell wall-associated NlpC family hydrolase